MRVDRKINETAYNGWLFQFVNKFSDKLGRENQSLLVWFCLFNQLNQLNWRIVMNDRLTNMEPWSVKMCGQQQGRSGESKGDMVTIGKTGDLGLCL